MILQCHEIIMRSLILYKLSHKIIFLHCINIYSPIYIRWISEIEKRASRVNLGLRIYKCMAFNRHFLRVVFLLSNVSVFLTLATYNKEHAMDAIWGTQCQFEEMDDDRIWTFTEGSWAAIHIDLLIGYFGAKAITHTGRI